MPAPEMPMLEIILTTTPEAAQGRGLNNVRSFLESEGLQLERILQGTGDGGQREFHRLLVPSGDAERIVAALTADPDVDSAYISPRNAPLPLSNTNYRSYQTYLNPAAAGLGAAYLHSFPGGKGAGIGFIDVENGWNLNHEELAGQVTLAGGFNRPEDADHGTAVLSIIKGQHTGSGVDGIAPDCTARAYSIYTSNSTSNRAAAIQAAANLLSSGDVMLLEVQAFGPRYNYAAGSQSTQDGCIPVEWFPAEYEAIKFATNKGVIVVECAANGYENLDDALYDTKPSGFPSWWVNPFRRTTLDSGAIIVGAGYPPVTQQGSTNLNAVRINFSDFGSCVDVQAWGNNVMSAGYGTLYQGAGPNEWYRRDFSGTSAAGALVAGCLISLAGALKGAYRPALTPSSARAALRATGTAQREVTGFPATERIGNQIDVAGLSGYFGLQLPRPSDPPPRPGVTSRRKRFILTLMDPLGQETLAVYDSITNPGPIVGGFVSHRYPNGTCGTLNFEARPDRLTGGEPRNICKLVYDTGEAIVPVHYGVLTINPDPNRKNRGNYQSVSGKELLKNSPIPDTFDINFGSEVDGAIWLRLLGANCKHKALKYNADLIPLTGQMFAGSMYDAAGATLYEVFEAIIKGCPNIGEDDWGVDPEGFIVVRPAAGTVTLDYDRVTREFLTGDIYSEDTCTSAKINLVREVSEGAVVSPKYRPRVISYSYTDPSHPAYEAPRTFKLPEKKDGSPILEVLAYTPGLGYSWSTSLLASTTNTNPSVYLVLSDGDLNTYAYPSGSGDISISTQPSDAKGFVGAGVVIDAPAGTYNLRLTVYYRVVSSNPLVTKYSVTFDLNNLKGLGKVEARFIAPAALDASVNRVDATLDVTNTVPTSLKIYELRGLEANKPLLEQVAKSNIKLPAREVTEITCARRVTRTVQGDAQELTKPFLLTEPGKYVAIRGVPTPDGKTITVTNEIKEIVDTYSTQEDMFSRIGAGGKIRSPEVMAISNAINRRLEAG